MEKSWELARECTAFLRENRDWKVSRELKNWERKTSRRG